MDPAARAGAAAAPGAVVVPAAAAPPAAAAAAQRAALLELRWMRMRRRWAQVLFVLGFLAAALAFFSINSDDDTADSRRLLGACAPTDAEAGALRAAAEEVLVATAAQILAATTALLVPAPLFAVVGTLLGSMTGYLASHWLWMLVACHARHDSVLAIFYWVFIAMLCVAYLVGCIISVCLSDSE